MYCTVLGILERQDTNILSMSQYILYTSVYRFQRYCTDMHTHKHTYMCTFLFVIVLQNVELQNAELQNTEFQKIELQNAELQNAELQNVKSYGTSNLTKRRNTKRQILQNVEIQNVDYTKRQKNDRIGWLICFEIIYFSLHCD
jgi:hypothetical protein